MSEKKPSEIDSKAKINTPDSEKKESEKTDPVKKKSKYLDSPFFNRNEILNSQYQFSAAIGSALNPSFIPLSSLDSWKAFATQLTSSVYIPSETLNSEQSQLRKEVRELAQSLEETKRESAKYIESKKQLEEKLKTLEQKTILSYILSNIRPDAQEMIFQNEGFKNLFEKTTICNSFVLSIDIRRSTELMLKARLPHQFAQFIRGLCVTLSEIIIGNYGVFDKFTGDGVLAYFPDFYSGPDAGLFALDSALKAHIFFEKHYEENRNCFSSVLSDIGLGIGIDYGTTYMVKIPVSYPCWNSRGFTCLPFLGSKGW